MAQAVELALEEKRHLIVEAGTGTGKTLAYLVPAILSGRKVVVSTATRALQEQIFIKDLPVVTEALAAHGVRFRAALMKGLGNYLCLRRMNEARISGTIPATLTDFKIDPPSLLALPVKDAIPVRVEMTWRKEK